jgi:asparaginyl-tRNA synthetase
MAAFGRKVVEEEAAFGHQVVVEEGDLARPEDSIRKIIESGGKVVRSVDPAGKYVVADGSIQVDRDPDTIVGRIVVVTGHVSEFRTGKGGRMGFVKLRGLHTVRTIQCILDTAPDDAGDPRHREQSIKDTVSTIGTGSKVTFVGIIVASPGNEQAIELQVQRCTFYSKVIGAEEYPFATKDHLPVELTRRSPHLARHMDVKFVTGLIKGELYAATHRFMEGHGIGEIQPTELTGNECEEGAHPFLVTTLFSKEKMRDPMWVTKLTVFMEQLMKFTQGEITGEDLEVFQRDVGEFPLIESGDKAGQIDWLKVVGDLPRLTDGTVDWSKDFFGKRVYMTVSSQLHLEAAVLGSMKDGYTMTIAGRAEPSTGRFHAAAFLMMEWELLTGTDPCIEGRGGLYGIDRNIAVAEGLIKYVIASVLDEYAHEVQFLDDYRTEVDFRKWLTEHADELPDTQSMGKKQKRKLHIKQKETFMETYERAPLVGQLARYRDEPFVSVTHKECVRRMHEYEAAGKVVFDESPTYDGDFTRQHEHYICKLADGLPVVVKQYPKGIKAFYMPVVDEDGTGTPWEGVEHVDCYDLLMPEVGEVVGGSQRIHDADELVERMTELGMDREELDWYIDLRRKGTFPHGGAGIGFSRLLLVLTGLESIRDLQEFPRAYGLACYA